MAAEPVLTFSLASVVEDVLQQHDGRLDVNLASRKAEEACIYHPFSPFFTHQFHFFFTLRISLCKSISFCVCVKLIANVVFLFLFSWPRMLVSSFNP